MRFFFVSLTIAPSVVEFASSFTFAPNKSKATTQLNIPNTRFSFGTSTTTAVGVGSYLDHTTNDDGSVNGEDFSAYSPSTLFSEALEEAYPSTGSSFAMEAAPTSGAVINPTDITLIENVSDSIEEMDILQAEYLNPPTTRISLFQSLTSTIQEFDINNPSLLMGRLIVLVAAMIYGTNFAMVKMVDDVMPMPVSAALRFGIAAIVVGGAVLGSEISTDKSSDANVGKSLEADAMAGERNAALIAGIEIGLWYCVGYICQAKGLETMAAGKSAFFSSLAIIVVPLLDAAFKSKILNRRDLASVALSCVGVGLLELGPAGGLKLSVGDMLAFGQTLAFGIGYWRLEAVSHRYPNQASRLTVGQVGAVAAGSVAFAIFGSELTHFPSVNDFSQWFSDPFIVGALTYTGLISTALALYFETVAMKVVSASELTLLMTTVSLWGAGFAYLTMGEVLSTTGMIGGLLILSACVLGNLEEKAAS